MRALSMCIVACLVAACRSATPPMQACTLIGCSDGVTIIVAGAPPARYTVALELPDGRRRSLRCEAAAGCAAGLFFEDVSAEQVTVEISSDAGTSVHEVRPSYVESQPNGPDCPPVCRQARVEVRFDP